MDGKRLKFLRDVLGARVWRLHRAYRFACSPFMAGFMELKHSERRQLKMAGSVVAKKVVKLTQNAIFGRCCMNPDKFRNTNAYVDPAKFERAVGKSSVTNFELQINDSEGFLAFVETLKTDRSKACMSVPTQVGARTLQLSKLMMEKAYYLHMRRLFPKMRLLFTDTDSVMVQIFELQDPLHAMAEANLNGAALLSKDPERDLSALSAAARAKAIEVMGQLGKLGDETFPARILEYVGLRSKMYSILTVQPDGARKEKRKIKGVPKKAVTNVRHLEYAGALAQPGAAADAGRLRSARLCALRPRDGVPRGAPASGARSDTAAAAEPLLGVDCRNLKKRKIPSSRFLVFSLSRFLNDFEPPQLLNMTSSAAFRCVQAWLLEKPAAWADEDAPCLAAALMAQRPPCDMQRKRPREDALLEAERSHQRHLIAQLDWELLGETLCRMELERENRHLRRRVGGLNDIIDRDRERARERIEELEHSNRILRLRLAHLG